MRALLVAGLMAAAAAVHSDFGRFMEEEDVAGDVDFGSGTPVSELVTLTFTADNDVSSYTSTIITAIEAKFATAAGVSNDTVTVSVRPGSVHMTVSIQTTASTSATVTSALSSSTSSTAGLTSLLTGVGIDITVSAITSPLTTSAAPPSAPPSSPPSTGLSAGAIAGICVGSVLGGLLLLFICYKAVRNCVDSPGMAPLAGDSYKNAGRSEHYGSELTANKGAVDII